MSYCRFGKDSDVYLYKHVDGGWTCCECELEAPIHSVSLPTAPQVAHHLEQHVAAGHKVPQYALDRVNAELAQ